MDPPSLTGQHDGMIGPAEVAKSWNARKLDFDPYRMPVVD
jgi:hypothetical protein